MAEAADAAAGAGEQAQAAAANGTAAAPDGDAVLQLLRKFQQLQAERAAGYSQMHAAFLQALASGNEGPYRQLMQQLTGQFSDISRQVLELVGQLAGSHEDLAALLRRVQEGERDKLRYTLTLQALRTAEAVNRFSWQQQAGEDAEKGDQPAGGARSAEGCGGCAAGAGGAQNGGGSSEEAHTGANGAAAHPGNAAAYAGDGVACGIDVHAAAAVMAQHQCSSHTHHGSAHGHTDDAPCGVEEPTEHEFRNAVAEATQLLDSCIAGINEALEEVMCVIVDES